MSFESRRRQAGGTTDIRAKAAGSIGVPVDDLFGIHPAEMTDQQPAAAIVLIFAAGSIRGRSSFFAARRRRTST
jgi:hypothetical protein